MKKSFILIMISCALLCVAGIRSARAMQPAETLAVAAADEETFDVVLTDVGTSMVKVVKALRTTLGIELKDAYALANNLPSLLRTKVSSEEAQKIQKEIETAGGTVKVKKTE